MVITLHVVLIACALLCFVASAAGVASRVNLQSAGLALWMLALLIGR